MLLYKIEKKIVKGQWCSTFEKKILERSIDDGRVNDVGNFEEKILARGITDVSNLNWSKDLGT